MSKTGTYRGAAPADTHAEHMQRLCEGDMDWIRDGDTVYLKMWEDEEHFTIAAATIFRERPGCEVEE